MEQENDFIKREIQKLTMILMKLFDKTKSADANSFEAVVFETNEKLEEFFGFTLIEIATTENSELMDKVESFHEVHLEKLIEVVYKTIQKSEEFKSDLDFETKELSYKLMLLIDFANDKCKSFSVERMIMKNQIEANLKINNN